MGFQRVGTSKYVLQPFDNIRLNLDALFLVANLSNAILVPLQVAFGWPRYWSSAFYIACILDVLAIVDCISYMFTGFMLPAQDDLFDEEKEQREQNQRDAMAQALDVTVGGTDPSKRQRKKSFIRRTVSDVSTEDATLSKVVEDAGIPKLVLDYRMILNYYISNHIIWDLLFLAGCFMDFFRISGDPCFFLMLKLISLHKAYKVSLANLTNHSERFQEILDHLATQAALLHYIFYLVFFCHWIGCLFLFFAWRETSHRSRSSEMDDDGVTIDGKTLNFLGKDSLTGQ